MKLKDFIQILETLAPPELAEDWDNTGLLIEPLNARDIKTVLLTIDLTEAVAGEAVRLNADFIVAYHPVFFSGFQSLETSDPQARTALLLIGKGIGVYSPHTALDAAPGGVNDWLAGLFDGETTTAGQTRVVVLRKPATLPALGKRVKEELKLHTVQIAPAGKTIRTIALCAGSGTDALHGVQADCYLTGEMKHHDVLAAVQKGISVILCGHTETERGYLPVFAKNLRTLCGLEFQVVISKTDRALLRTI